MRELMYGSALGPASFAAPTQGNRSSSSSSSSNNFSRPGLPAESNSRSSISNSKGDGASGAVVGSSSVDFDSGVGTSSAAAAPAVRGAGKYCNGGCNGLDAEKSSNSSTGGGGDASTVNGSLLLPAAIDQGSEGHIRQQGRDLDCTATAAGAAVAAAAGIEPRDQLGNSHESVVDTVEEQAAAIAAALGMLKAVGPTGVAWEENEQLEIIRISSEQAFEESQSCGPGVEAPAAGLGEAGACREVTGPDGQRQQQKQQQQLDVEAWDAQEEEHHQIQQPLAEQGDGTYTLCVLADSNGQPMQKQQLDEDQQQVFAKDGCRPSDQDRSKKPHQQQLQQVWEVDVSACPAAWDCTPAGAGAAVSILPVAPAVCPAAAAVGALVGEEGDEDGGASGDAFAALQLGSSDGCNVGKGSSRGEGGSMLGATTVAAAARGVWQQDQQQQQQREEWPAAADEACDEQGECDEQQEEVVLFSGAGQWQWVGAGLGAIPTGKFSSSSSSDGVVQLGMQQQQEEGVEQGLGSIAEALALRERLGLIPHMVSSTPSAVSRAGAEPCGKLGLSFGSTALGLTQAERNAQSAGGSGVQVTSGMGKNGIDGLQELRIASQSSSGDGYGGVGSEGELGGEIGLGLVGLGLGLELGESNSNSISSNDAGGRGLWGGVGLEGSPSSFLVAADASGSAAAGAFPLLPSLGSGRCSLEGGDWGRVGVDGGFAARESSFMHPNAAALQEAPGVGGGNGGMGYGIWDAQGPSWCPQEVMGASSMGGGDGAVHVSRDGSKEVTKGVGSSGGQAGPLTLAAAATQVAAAAAVLEDDPALLAAATPVAAAAAAVLEDYPALLAAATPVAAAAAVLEDDPALLVNLASDVWSNSRTEMRGGAASVSASASAAAAAGASGKGQAAVGSPGRQCEEVDQKLGQQNQLLSEPWGIEAQQQAQQQQEQAQDGLSLVQDVLQGLQDFLQASGLDQAIEVRLRSGVEQEQTVQAQAIEVAPAAVAALGENISAIHAYSADSGEGGQKVGRGLGSGSVYGLKEAEVQRVVELGAQRGLLSLSFKPYSS